MAKMYYNEFRKQMAADHTKELRVAVIYSYGANQEEADGILDIFDRYNFTYYNTLEHNERQVLQ